MLLELITDDLIARQPPEAQAIIRILLAKIAELEAQLNGLRKTSQNSSLPPSTPHPHAKPVKPKSKSNKNRGGREIAPMIALRPTAKAMADTPTPDAITNACAEYRAGWSPAEQDSRLTTGVDAQVWLFAEILRPIAIAAGHVVEKPSEAVPGSEPVATCDLARKPTEPNCSGATIPIWMP